MWSNFEASPLEDETISNAFSSRGIFKISSDDVVKEQPVLHASVQNGKMVISIDKCIFLLEDELVAKCSYLSFSSQIDAITISNSGNLIVCGLSDGEVHGVFIKGALLFSVCIALEDVHMTGGTFVAIQQLGERFYFICRNGSIYCLSDIDEVALEAAFNLTLTNNETVACDKAILEDVNIQRLSMGRALGNVDCSVLLKQLTADIYAENNQETQNSDHGLTLAGAQETVLFKTVSSDITRFKLPKQFGSIKHIYDLEHCVIALTTSGQLLEICPFTRTANFCQSSQGVDLLIEDLLVMECSEDNVELLILTKCAEDGRLIKIIEYPSMKCKNEVEVARHAWLVRQPKSAVNLYYLAAKQENEVDIPREVEMMLVSETDPSDRFKKLVAKGRLEEAEEFGKQFELCLQPIFEAKAKRVLIELSNANAHDVNAMEQKFNTLLDLLAKIESKKFITSNRMINLPSRHILERYLKEVLKRLDYEEDGDHMLEINEQLHRLKTLSITDPYECNSEWQKFVYHTNLVKMVKSLFNSDMGTACLIWRRHFSSILPRLNEDRLRKLLSFIPSNTEPFNIVQWLRQFIPTVSNTHPTIMPFIASWTIEKTRELQYGDHWPDIGLEFSTKILEIFEEIQFIYSDVRRQHEHNIGKLRNLVNALQDLTVLKSSYNLIFTLDNYLQDSLDATALCILQLVHLDKLHKLVNDFLYPIFQEKGLMPLSAIQQYIFQLVANRHSLSNWLERSVACIELLHNEDSRLECALLVLQNAPVPWPETLAPLIKLRTSTHPLAVKINAEYEIQVIKIMKVKYGWPADSGADINLELFMMRIVKLNLPDMVKDIRTLTKAAPEISTSANFNCCYEMARRGQIEMAHDFFMSLKSEKDSKHAIVVVEIFLNLLENSPASFVNDAQVLEHKNLLELFKLMLPHVDSAYERRYLIIKHRFQLHQKFKLVVNGCNELVPLRERLSLLDEAIEGIIERSQATLNVSAFIASEVSDLCTALCLQKMFGIQRICKRINCLPLTCALAYYVIQFVDCQPENKDDFINLAIELLVQQIANAKGQTNDSPSSMQLLTEIDPLSFPLAYELLTAALLHERSRNRDLTELLKYVRVAVINYPLDAIDAHYQGKEQDINELICRALDGMPIATGENTLNFSIALNNSLSVKPNLPAKKRYSVSMFDEVDVELQQQLPQKRTSSGRLPTVKFLARTLLLMVIETEPNNSLLLQVRNSLDDQIKDDIDGARADFFLSLEQLTKAKEHDVWYLMSQYLLEYQKQNNCKKIINEGFITLQLRRFFRNAMNHKDVNFIELFTMLVADSEALGQLDKLASDVKTDQQKINFLTLSEMYNVHMEDTENVQLIRTKRIKLYYYLEFCKQDPSIKGKFNADMDNIDHLLKEFHNKQLNVQLLERMSRDFGFDYQKILITQILSILSAQELRYEIKYDSFGDEELVMLSNVKEMRDMCQPYLSEIKNVELFTGKLKYFIEEINIYFYELYLCVIEMLMFFDAAPKEMNIWTNILHFLQHKMIFRRRNRPGQLETDMWLQSQKENGVLPKIARYRLPFKPIVEKPLKDILDSELNVDNCQSWFPLIQMYTALKGSKDVAQNCDYFCMSAVKNSIDEYKSKNDSETWSLHPTNNAFLKSILRLVKNVHNPCKVFLILYFVASYATDGADQVEASYECWKYAKEQGALINDPKCQGQLSKIKRKYPIIKTQHLLYVYGLTDEKLLRLVENPTELIHSLYHHELILKSSKLDINTLVKDIANLHELNLDAIQFKLLQKWLSVTMEPADGTILEETFLEDQNWPEGNGVGDDTSNASENVIRANYVLNSWPKTEAVQFLVGLIFKGGSVNTSNQLQMYECYSKLNDGSNSFSNTIDQRQYITIKCVHELNALGYKSNIEKFANDHCNKIEILKMIWQRNAQNPLSLEVMANICLGFDIHIPKIWNGILKRMVMFNMVQELNTLVDVVSSKQQLLHIDGLALAWDCVLCHPLKNSVQTRSFAQEELLHKTLLRLQSCPVVHALNLFQFAELCVLIQRCHMAAVVLSFCQTEEQREKIKNLINAHPVESLRKQILELEDAGILPVVLNFALKELNL